MNVLVEIANKMWFQKKIWSWSHVTTDGQWVGKSWCRAHCGTCDQILNLSEFCCLFPLWHPHWREVGSASCQSLSAVIVHRQVFFVQVRSYFTTDGQSVSQYVLVSSTLVGLATIYYLLSECCCLKLPSCFWGGPSLTRGRVCNLQC
jgi:hypothetical protein